VTGNLKNFAKFLGTKQGLGFKISEGNGRVNATRKQKEKKKKV
jgi:hypothetical protein